MEKYGSIDEIMNRYPSADVYLIDMALCLPGKPGCRPDDILDALCLATAAGMKAHGLFETVPADPEKDARGIIMQMVIPPRGKD